MTNSFPSEFKSPVGLIIPPSPFLLDERVFMPLGVLKIAAVLKARGIEARVLDLSGLADIGPVVCDFVQSTGIRVFGISSTTPQFPFAAEIARTIREARPDAHLILGGPHATLTAASVKRHAKAGVESRASELLNFLKKSFDVIVVGDGEFAVFDALTASRGTIIDADNPNSPLFVTNEEFDRLPFPDRSAIDVESYHFEFEGVRGLSLIAQLGCPFACGFCAGRSSPSFRRIRLRTPENVVHEVEHLRDRYGVRGFMFYDDELNVNPQFENLMRGLAEAQARRGESFVFRGCVKAELFTENQGALMREAGFKTILVGFESGSPRILRNINKKATVDDNSRCREIAARHEIKVKALMSVGHPGESPDTVSQTHDWLLKASPDEFDVSIITVLPGTPYYDDAQIHDSRSMIWVYSAPCSGDRLYSYDIDFSQTAAFYKGNPDEAYNSFVFTDFMSQSDLVTARDYLERSVREKLHIAYPGAAAKAFDHSMGQFGPLQTKFTALANIPTP
jgi:radical SAM superfamily enzyme YgiQ (UPF0313 family)